MLFAVVLLLVASFCSEGSAAEKHILIVSGSPADRNNHVAHWHMTCSSARQVVNNTVHDFSCVSMPRPLYEPLYKTAGAYVNQANGSPSLDIYCLQTTRAGCDRNLVHAVLGLRRLGPMSANSIVNMTWNCVDECPTLDGFQVPPISLLAASLGVNLLAWCCFRHIDRASTGKLPRSSYNLIFAIAKGCAVPVNFLLILVLHWGEPTGYLFPLHFSGVNRTFLLLVCSMKAEIDDFADKLQRHNNHDEEIQMIDRSDSGQAKLESLVDTADVVCANPDDVHRRLAEHQQWILLLLPLLNFVASFGPFFGSGCSGYLVFLLVATIFGTVTPTMIYCSFNYRPNVIGMSVMVISHYLVLCVQLAFVLSPSFSVLELPDVILSLTDMKCYLQYLSERNTLELFATLSIMFV